MDHYRAAGEMLLEAKSQMKHGEFMSWCRANFKREDGKPYTAETITLYRVMYAIKFQVDLKFQVLANLNARLALHTTGRCVIRLMQSGLLTG